MSLSRIVADSVASNTIVVNNIAGNTITSAKLTTTGVVANQYGNSTHISVIDVDAAGRITNATTSSIQTHLDTAYSNAVSVANTTSFNQAANAYANAVATANTTSFNQAANAYANAVSDATNLAANAYANAVATANTTSYNQAANAYANVFNGGTFSGVTTFTANLTGNSVTLHGNLQIDGNLTVGGNTVTMNVSTLSVEDNMVYLNSGSAVAHPDLGIAGNYNDGTYRHAGVFRDATDGVWKFFHQYEPEPDASAYIDTANNTFKLANVQANTFIGNLSGDASTVGSNTASTLRTYSSDLAANAYSNATSYAATVAGTAYSNATSYAATVAGTAYSNATSYAATVAGTAYSNAVSSAASTYLPLSGGTLTNNLKINPTSESWGEGLQFYMPTTSTWGGIRWVRNRSNYYGSWYIGYTALDSGNDLVFGTNASGTQVDNILRLYNSSSGSVRAGRDLYVYGNSGGSYGNRLIVGATDTAYTAQDTNLRPTIQIHGQYPVLSLNHTVTNNANHGPTIQFTCNGTGNQFVIGTGGSGTMLSMGYSSVSDWNPHNGISGYNGTSFFQASTNGYIGIGSNGDWTVSGGTGTTVPGYNLHFIGVTNGTNGHAALFRNNGSGNSGNGNGSGFCFVNTYGDHSWGITAELRVDGSLGTDRPSLLFSNGYDSNTWSCGFGYADSSYFRINRDHGHRNGSWGTTLFYMDRSGNATYSGALNASAYYYTSDRNHKKNIVTLDSDSYRIISHLNPVKFDWIETNKEDAGFIAQEVEEIVSYAVNKNKDDKTDDYTYTLSSTAILAHLTKTVQILMEKVGSLEQQLSNLTIK